MSISAISATRRQVRELVDGTLEVRIHIDSHFKRAFHEMFPDIDTPIALAPLRLDFDQPKEEKSEAPKGGPLAKSAGIICNEPEFQTFAASWLRAAGVVVNPNPDSAAEYVRIYCCVRSRADLDHNPEAAKLFAQLMAEYREWLK